MSSATALQKKYDYTTAQYEETETESFTSYGWHRCM